MAKRGRPRNDSVRDFSVYKTTEEGLYLVRFKVGRHAFCAVVRDGERPPKDTVETLSPYQTFCKIAKRFSKYKRSSRYNLGASEDAVARRLTKQFRLNRPR
jgi:hypothetical protein